MYTSIHMYWYVYQYTYWYVYRYSYWYAYWYILVRILVCSSAGIGEHVPVCILTYQYAIYV